MSQYKIEEVKKHNNEDSLWIIHNKKVYDVTQFIEKHPGGRHILMEYASGSAAEPEISTTMKNPSIHRHTKLAYTMLKKYFIGHLVCDKHDGNANIQHEPAEDLNQLHSWRDDELIDWGKPILHQVGSLGKNYWRWVHSPVDHHVRLFYSDFCEYFSEAAWYQVPIVWLPVLTYLLYLSIIEFDESKGCLGLNLSCFPCLFLFGMCLWTLAEYVLHRWLFHMAPPTTWPSLIMLHFVIHGQHHKAPFDRYRLVFPPVPAACFAVFFYFLFWLFLRMDIARVVYAGGVAGYIMYDLTHYYLHHGSPTRGNLVGAYFQGLKNYHVRHHFEDQTKGFGISSKLWDYPFRTLLPRQQEE